MTIEADFELKRRQIAYYLILFVLEAVILLGVFLAVPAERQTGGFLGLSGARWVIVGFFLAVIVLGLGFLWQFSRDRVFAERVVERLRRFISLKGMYSFLLIGNFFLFVFLLQFIGFVLAAENTVIGAYGSRLLPLIIWVSLLSLQTLVWLPIFRYGKLSVDGLPFQANLRAGLIVLGVLLVVWGFILASGVGLKPDLIGWYEPGAPLLSFQGWLAWLLFILFLLVIAVLKPYLRLVDVGVMFVIWLAAFWMWESQPMLPNFFAPRPTPPTYEFFPYSDAVSYDLTSHRVVLGLKDPLLPSKPLYGYFLAALRAIQGGSYDGVVRLQVAVLALFPVLIYGIVSALHHRATGFLAALLIIFREANAIQLSGLIKVAHAKLLLSDLPTAVYLAFLLWVVVQWLKVDDASAKQRSLYPAFVLGALGGFSLLLRPQTTILIPAVGIFILWVWRKKPWKMLQAVLLMASGVFLALSGWFWYSWQHTGFLLLNDPWQTAYMTSVYHLSPDVVDVDVNRLPRRAGESLGEYDARVRRSVAEFTLHYPHIVAQFVSAHFFHNQIESLLALPLSPFWFFQSEPRLLARWQDQTQRLIDDCCSVRTYVKRMPFWDAWDGHLPPETLLLFCFNLAMVALGIGVSWRKQKMITIFALLINGVYVLSSAMGRQSGWRFVLPVDWIVIMFYAVGVAELTFWGVSAAYKYPQLSSVLNPQAVEGSAGSQFVIRTPFGKQFKWWLSIFIVLIVSWSFNIVEWLIPLRYPMKAAAEFNIRLNESDKQWLLAHDFDVNNRNAWEKGGWVVLEGRALYPRFIRANQENVYPPLAVNYLPDENRLIFYLLGPQEVWIAMSKDKPPLEMKHAEDAVVIGCQRMGFFEALGVMLLPANSNEAVLLRADRSLEPCAAVP